MGQVGMLAVLAEAGLQWMFTTEALKLHMLNICIFLYINYTPVKRYFLKISTHSGGLNRRRIMSSNPTSLGYMVSSRPAENKTIQHNTHIQTNP